MVADRLHGAGGGIDLDFEEFIADRIGFSIAEAEAASHRGRAGRTFARNPGEAERGDFDDGVQRGAVKLAGFDRTVDGQRRFGAVEFQRRAAGEAARIQQQVAGLIGCGADLQTVGKCGRDSFFQGIQPRDRRPWAYLDCVF